jgi:DNA-binding NarL/FixJ family response regulator
MRALQQRCHSSLVRGTVLIVDDHAGFRAAARALLEAGGFVVIGEAADGEAALAAVERLRPTIVLLDVQLPDLDGFVVAERLAAAETATPAIVLTSSRSIASIRWRLDHNPAWRFIPKAQLSGEALAAALV